MHVKTRYKPKWFNHRCAFAALLILAVESLFAADHVAALDVDVPKVRLDAPTFTLHNLVGGETALADFAGKVVLLNFWATWCAPCREEMPAMQQLWERYRARGFVIVAVAADRGNQDQVAAFVAKHELSYPVLLDPEGDVRNRYEVSVLPTSYFIARDGRISGRVIGIRDWDSPEADTVVTRLLAIEK
ncbi:MAG TPA: TlpA family protein disulfide reductase [Candidatus Tenderia electrophaga]|uniref:TlpA family protein disulfide reductase n=1 Tax=Candidatus Tenderia electrophaga TaxID=1748243 RepID=A0A832J2A2_9GAMM|nr:TlpA family protein disulfide reductase [Candidatus Tenderia electrophaga]